MLKRGSHRLVQVYNCQNATLLRLICFLPFDSVSEDHLLDFLFLSWQQTTVPLDLGLSLKPENIQFEPTFVLFDLILYVPLTIFQL